MRGEPFVTADFSGGVNLNASPYTLANINARDLINVQPSALGSFKKRNGFGTFASPSIPIRSLGTFQRPASNFLVGFADDGVNTDIYSIDTGGSVSSIDGAFTATTGYVWDSIQAPASGGQGPLYMLNGQDTPKQWTGAGNIADWTASGGTLPNGKYIIYHDNRIMIAGVQTDAVTRSRLYASNIIDPRDWASPGSVNTVFDPDDGQDITALGTAGPYAMVFKPRKIFVVTDSDSLAYRNMTDEVGCSAHRTIQSTDHGTFFLSSDRRVMITNGIELEDISESVKPLLDQINNFEKCNSAFYDDKYLISIAVSGENDYILEYDTTNGSWWIHQISLDTTTTTAPSDWAILTVGSTSTLYCSVPVDMPSLTTSRVFEAFKANTYVDRDTETSPDRTVVYPSHWTTGWETYNQPHLRKIIRQLRVDGIGQYDVLSARSFGSTLTTEENLLWEQAETENGGTFGGSGTFGGAGTYGGEVLVEERRFYTPGVARAWSWKISAQGGPMEIYAYTTAVEMRTD